MPSVCEGRTGLGNLQQRHQILSALDNLPQAPLVFSHEVDFFIESQQLFGLGIGYIDAHLLASVKLIGTARLWTRDKRLSQVASKLNLAAAVDLAN